MQLVKILLYEYLIICSQSSWTNFGIDRNIFIPYMTTKMHCKTTWRRVTNYLGSEAFFLTFLFINVETLVTFLRGISDSNLNACLKKQLSKCGSCWKDFVGISLDWIIVEASCRWKLWSGNLHIKFISNAPDNSHLQDPWTIYYSIEWNATRPSMHSWTCGTCG